MKLNWYNMALCFAGLLGIVIWALVIEAAVASPLKVEDNTAIAAQVFDNDPQKIPHYPEANWECGAATMFDRHGQHRASGSNYPQARLGSLGACMQEHIIGCLPVPLSCRRN